MTTFSHEEIPQPLRRPRGQTLGGVAGDSGSAWHWIDDQRSFRKSTSFCTSRPCVARPRDNHYMRRKAESRAIDCITQKTRKTLHGHQRASGQNAPLARWPNSRGNHSRGSRCQRLVMYIDSAIIVKLLVQEELSNFFQDTLADVVLYSSELSIVEVGSALLSKVRSKAISQKQRLVAREIFQNKIAGEQIIIMPLDSPVYSKARSLIEFCHPNVALRTLDAIHLAACDISQEFPLCATGSRMRAAADKLGIPLFPETLPS